MQLQLTAVVPAAGIGKRMGAECPKQYLMLRNKPILQHTLERLLAFEPVSRVIVALSVGDEWYQSLSIFNDPRIELVPGGAERADSVLNALNQCETPWVMVHDAVRPCITPTDLDALWQAAQVNGEGAVLAMPVRDTMKRSDDQGRVQTTVERECLWHALTPQLFQTRLLREAIEQGISSKKPFTDESSAMEYLGYQPQLVVGRADNIKVTHPDDLALAEIYMQLQESEHAYRTWI